MVTNVTMWKTQAGTVCESQAEAIQKEKEEEAYKLSRAFIAPMIREHQTEPLTHDAAAKYLLTMIDQKSYRQILRDLLIVTKTNRNEV